MLDDRKCLVPKGLLFWFGILAVISISCNRSANDSLLQANPLWQGTKKIVLDRLLSVGVDDFDKPEYVFGFISDIWVDDWDNLYILDFRNSRICKYSSEGQYIASFGRGKGQGPGEFEYPANVCTNGSGELFVSDKNAKRISIFGISGEFVKNLPLDMAPSRGLMIVDSVLIVGIDPRYITNGLWRKGLYQLYSLAPWKRIGSLGASWDAKLLSSTIGTFSLCHNRKSNQIIISYPLPYLIEIYSEDDTLLRRFGRKVPFFGITSLDRYNNLTTYGSSLKVSCLPDGKIINLIRQYVPHPNGKDAYKSYLDFFDQKGTYLLTISQNEISGMENREFRGLASDSRGNLWISVEEPYPHVVKYKLSFVDQKND
jgi:hypothetical protein